MDTMKNTKKSVSPIVNTVAGPAMVRHFPSDPIIAYSAPDSTVFREKRRQLKARIISELNVLSENPSCRYDSLPVKCPRGSGKTMSGDTSCTWHMQRSCPGRMSSADRVIRLTVSRAWRASVTS